jgi:hypothetical protein
MPPLVEFAIRLQLLDVTVSNFAKFRLKPAITPFREQALARLHGAVPRK